MIPLSPNSIFVGVCKYNTCDLEKAIKNKWVGFEMSKMSGENRQPNAARIWAEKIMIRGETKFRITRWRNILRAEDTPSKYANGCGPKFYVLDDPRYVGLFEEGRSTLTWSIVKGSVYTPTEFGKILATMKDAGERLAKLNREIKALEKEWCEAEKEYVI